MKKSRSREITLAAVCVFCVSIAAVLAVAEGGKPMLGDANSDGVVDARDAARIQEFVVKGGESSEENGDANALELDVCDITGDGKIDSRDAAQVLRYSAAAGLGYTGTLEDFMKEGQSQ